MSAHGARPPHPVSGANSYPTGLGMAVGKWPERQPLFGKQKTLDVLKGHSLVLPWGSLAFGQILRVRDEDRGRADLSRQGAEAHWARSVARPGSIRGTGLGLHGICRVGAACWSHPSLGQGLA